MEDHAMVLVQRHLGAGAPARTTVVIAAGTLLLCSSIETRMRAHGLQPLVVSGRDELESHLRTAVPEGTVVVHDTDDVDTAWTAMRLGGRPCPTRHLRRLAAGESISESGLCHIVPQVRETLRQAPITDPADSVPAVRHALQHALEHQSVRAAVDLGDIAPGPPTGAAVDHLTAVTVRLLTIIRQRCRYPVAVPLVLERLAVHDDADVALCSVLLQRAGLRASGLEMSLDELVGLHGSGGVLFGAFHSTHALLRFVADRTWRNPRSVLAALG